MTLLAGVTIQSLEDALKNAGIQAQDLSNRYPEASVVDHVRVQIGHLYELIHEENRIWAKAGEGK